MIQHLTEKAPSLGNAGVLNMSNDVFRYVPNVCFF